MDFIDSNQDLENASYELIGQNVFDSIDIIKPSVLFPGDPKGIAFCKEKNVDKLSKSNCPAVIVPNSVKVSANEFKTYISVSNPKSLFIDICERFFPYRIIPPEFIHPTAIIDSKSVISEGTRIGPYSVIYGSRIGSDCVIYPGVVIYNTDIGNNVIIKSGTVIGYDGFGYYWVGKDQIKKFPHYGKVIIEDDVEIGANVTIDRGSLMDTIIKKGAKIDNLVHIAHGDEIGEQVIITAGVAVGGSTKVGQRTWLGIGASIKNGVCVGKNAFVSMGAVVSKDVPDGKKVTGNLAIDHNHFMENFKKSLKK
jgi:UDP-3-O-[3-hydroxymyristoyl] glucosamine N-acyltransferase